MNEYAGYVLANGRMAIVKGVYNDYVDDVVFEVPEGGIMHMFGPVKAENCIVAKQYLMNDYFSKLSENQIA